MLGFTLPGESKEARAGWTDLARVGVLVVFGLVMWRVAIHAMERS